MSVMDCRSFKDLLDSYLSGELAVETNHGVLRHAEQCATCRREMVARRDLRGLLRAAGTSPRLGAEGVERLRGRLRTEKAPRGPAFARFFPARFPAALTAAATLILILGAVYFLTVSQLSRASAAALSLALMSEAVGDHISCAARAISHEGPVKMPESAGRYDPAYADLDQVAVGSAQGLRLRAAHVCSFGGRRFAHLVYTRDAQLISLLVTDRDGRALRSGVVPPDDGLSAGLQQALRDHHTVSACQTAKHVVLVVSDLPEKESKGLTEQIAVPVCDHLRRVEARPRNALLRLGSIDPMTWSENMATSAISLSGEEIRLPQGFPTLMSLPHTEHTFWRGTTVYSLDDPATSIYVVVKGRVKILRASANGQQKIISIRYRGEVFGELALAGGAVEARRSDEAVALETTRVAVIRAEDFWQATHNNSAALRSVLHCLTARLAEAHRQIESLVFDNNYRRLARALLDLSIEASRVGEESVRLTHEELAELIGSTREVVTSMMIELRHRGLIAYKRGDVRPHLPKLVQFLAEEALPNS